MAENRFEKSVSAQGKNQSGNVIESLLEDHLTKPIAAPKQNQKNSKLEGST